MSPKLTARFVDEVGNVTLSHVRPHTRPLRRRLKDERIEQLRRHLPSLTFAILDKLNQRELDALMDELHRCHLCKERPT
jgi:hypothetical protein